MHSLGGQERSLGKNGRLIVSYAGGGRPFMLLRSMKVKQTTIAEVGRH